MLTFYIDGQSIGNETRGRPRRAKFAIAFKFSGPVPESSSVRVTSSEIGDKTNNEAEYHALLQLLSLISNNLVNSDGRILERVGEVRICSDSEVLVKQVSGEYRAKEERLRKLRDEAKEMIDRMGLIRLERLPREQNVAGLWLEGKIRATHVRPEQFLSGI